MMERLWVSAEDYEGEAPREPLPAYMEMYQGAGSGPGCEEGGDRGSGPVLLSRIIHNFEGSISAEAAKWVVANNTATSGGLSADDTVYFAPAAGNASC